MKNLFTILLTLGFILPATSQVWVKGNSYIYSKGTNVFIKSNLELEPNAKFYLRKEAQLIQSDNVANTGTGLLSVFQEGAANNFTYNYWSSPVSRTAGSGNNGFLNSQIHFPRIQPGFKLDSFTTSTDFTDLSTNLVTDSQQAMILPVATRDGLPDQQNISTAALTNPLRIAGRWLYKYNNAGAGGGSGYASWQPFVATTAVVEPGYGFTMKGVDPSVVMSPNLFAQGNGIFGQRYDFRGRPNNGNITVQVVADDFALIGNPYPSALDLKRFLEDNADYTTSVVMGNTVYTPTVSSQIDTQVLFWESKSTTHNLNQYIGGYGSYVPGAKNNYADNGMYVPSTFSRYDESGNIVVGGDTSGGSNGIAHPIGTGAGRRYAPIGQGFVITRTSTTNGGVYAPGVASVGNAVLRNSQRAFFKEDGMLSFFQSAPGSGNGQQQIEQPFVRPKIYLSAAINDLYVREFILAFGDDSTDGLDWGLEAVIDNNLQNNDIYMPQEGKKLIIKTIPFDETKKVPVSFTLATASTFEISIRSIQHFNTPFILLHDMQNGTVYDLKMSTATINLPAGTYNDRFEIVFQQPSTLSTGSATLSAAIDVIQNNNAQLLSVLNPQLKEIKNIAIYDIAGRQIISENVSGAQDNYTFNTSTYSTGVYIVRVNDAANNQTAIKVSIAN